MNKDEILIVKYPFLMKNDQATKLYESILKQKENGVIILPDYCEVVVAPKDAEIKVEMRDYTNEELAEAKPEQPKNNHGIERMTFGSR